MQSISVFEMIKIGIGPSSSHTMGPWKAAELFTAELEQYLIIGQVIKIEIHLFGSLAKTGRGHGTDVALTMGLSGENFILIDTSSIPEKIEKIKRERKILLRGKKEVCF